MASWYRITELIIGRAAADRFEQKRLDRKYKHVENQLKAISSVAPEPRLQQTPGATASQTPNQKRRDPIQLQPSVSSYRRSMSAPVISQRAPGMSEDTPLIGIGRYQHAANLPLDVRLKKLDEQIHAPDRLRFNPYCNTPPPCVDEELWEAYKASKSKVMNFYPSKQAPYEVKSRRVDEERIELNTGTQTKRGFSSTTTSRSQSDATASTSNGPRTPVDPIKSDKSKFLSFKRSCPLTEYDSNEFAAESDEDEWSDVEESGDAFGRIAINSNTRKKVSNLAKEFAVVLNRIDK